MHIFGCQILDFPEQVCLFPEHGQKIFRYPPGGSKEAYIHKLAPSGFTESLALFNLLFECAKTYGKSYNKVKPPLIHHLLGN